MIVCLIKTIKTNFLLGIPMFFIFINLKTFLSKKKFILVWNVFWCDYFLINLFSRALSTSSCWLIIFSLTRVVISFFALVNSLL